MRPMLVSAVRYATEKEEEEQQQRYKQYERMLSGSLTPQPCKFNASYGPRHKWCTRHTKRNGRLVSLYLICDSQCAFQVPRKWYHYFRRQFDLFSIDPSAILKHYPDATDNIDELFDFTEKVGEAR